MVIEFYAVCIFINQASFAQIVLKYIWEIIYGLSVYSNKCELGRPLKVK